MAAAPAEAARCKDLSECFRYIATERNDKVIKMINRDKSILKYVHHDDDAAACKMSLLQCAIHEDNIPIIEFILSKVSTSYLIKRQILIYCTRIGSPNALQAVIVRCRDDVNSIAMMINQTDEEGNSALHYAAASMHFGIKTGMLLHHRADITIVNRNGETPIDIARKNQNTMMIRLLLK